jgi:hypothetical protein
MLDELRAAIWNCYKMESPKAAISFNPREQENLDGLAY